MTVGATSDLKLFWGGVYLDYQIISYGTSESKAMIYTPLIALQATVYDCEAVKSRLRE